MRRLVIANGEWCAARAVGALFLGLITISPTSGTRAAEEENASGAIRVEVDGQALSVEVLQEVARQAGFDVEIRGDLGRLRPQVFEGVPIDRGIRRLVGYNRVNLVMRYVVDQAGERRLVAVIARAAGELPPEFLEQRRMRDELARIRVPPPPPPPTIQ